MTWYVIQPQSQIKENNAKYRHIEKNLKFGLVIPTKPITVHNSVLNPSNCSPVLINNLSDYCSACEGIISNVPMKSGNLTILKVCSNYAQSALKVWMKIFVTVLHCSSTDTVTTPHGELRVRIQTKSTGHCFA